MLRPASLPSTGRSDPEDDPVIVPWRPLVIAFVLVPVASSAPADERLVLDGNTFYANAGGASMPQYGSDAGGADCPGGPYDVLHLATVAFRHNAPDAGGGVEDPWVGDPRPWVPARAPRFDLPADSPAQCDHGAWIVDTPAIHPWFEGAAHLGGVGASGGNDWTQGWTF